MNALNVSRFKLPGVRNRPSEGLQVRTAVSPVSAGDFKSSTRWSSRSEIEPRMGVLGFSECGKYGRVLLGSVRSEFWGVGAPGSLGRGGTLRIAASRLFATLQTPRSLFREPVHRSRSSRLHSEYFAGILERLRRIQPRQIFSGDIHCHVGT